MERALRKDMRSIYLLPVLSLAAMRLARSWIERPARFPFRRQVAVVTGGSRGLGLILARKLAERGAHVAICARNGAELRRAAETIGGTVYTRVCDVADPGQVDEFFAAVMERFGRVDLVINNASVMEVGSVERMGLKEMRTAMDVNFWGTWHCIEAALPHFMRRRRGRIVNITSIGAVVPVPHLLPYTCAKFAAYGLSMAIGPELARHRIVVTTVVPGLMRTGSYINAQFEGRNQAERDAERAWFGLSSVVPGLSMSAERAADRVLRACERGEAFVVLGAPAKALRMFHALLPSASSRAFRFSEQMIQELLSARNDRAVNTIHRVSKRWGAQPIRRYQAKVS